MTSLSIGLLVVAFPLVLALAAIPAKAVDGVIEINQAIANAGGILGDLAADPAGFPVRVTQPGSYRLTGNLSVPLDTTAVQIDASNVTLDLGGFEIRGPNVCTGYPTMGCAVELGNVGINSSQFLVVVRNGSITGMGGDGIYLRGASSEVERVRVLSSGGFGINIGLAGRVTDSFSGGNLASGIGYQDGGVLIQGNESRANGGYGVFLNFVPGNPRLSGAVIGNRVFDNLAGGINVHAQMLVSRNVASKNGDIQIAGGVSLNDNLCEGTLC